MRAEAIFDTAARHAQWTSTRQAVVSSNIANKNVPDYTARQIEPFSQVLGQKAVRLAATNPTHFGVSNVQGGNQLPAVSDTQSSVRMEEQLAEATAVKNDMQLNLAISSAFHRMTLLVARS